MYTARESASAQSYVYTLYTLNVIHNILYKYAHAVLLFLGGTDGERRLTISTCVRDKGVGLMR